MKQIETNSFVPINFVKSSSSNAWKKFLIHVFIDNKKCVFESDTGAAVTCTNVKKFHSLCPNIPIKKT